MFLPDQQAFGQPPFAQPAGPAMQGGGGFDLNNALGQLPPDVRMRVMQRMQGQGGMQNQNGGGLQSGPPGMWGQNGGGGGMPPQFQGGGGYQSGPPGMPPRQGPGPRPMGPMQPQGMPAGPAMQGPAQGGGINPNMGVLGQGVPDDRMGRAGQMGGGDPNYNPAAEAAAMGAKGGGGVMGGGPAMGGGPTAAPAGPAPAPGMPSRGGGYPRGSVRVRPEDRQAAIDSDRARFQPPPPSGGIKAGGDFTQDTAPTKPSTMATPMTGTPTKPKTGAPNTPPGQDTRTKKPKTGLGSAYNA